MILTFLIGLVYLAVILIAIWVIFMIYGLIFYLLECIVNKIKKFASKYKRRELDIGYYRELNSDSSFVFTNSNGEITVKSEYATDRFLDDINDNIEGECFDIDISYNYMTYITKLIQRYFFIQTV